MIETPFMFEESMSDEDFRKIGQLSLRWSHIEHITGSCLKAVLRLSDDEARVVVFPISLEQRVNRIGELSEIKPLPENARFPFAEFKALLKGIQYVRNNVVHAIIEGGKGGHSFHLRSKNRTLSKAEIFSSEEITNYAAHVVIALRYGLGLKHGSSPGSTLPDRPEIPEFLRSVIRWP